MAFGSWNIGSWILTMHAASLSRQAPVSLGLCVLLALFVPGLMMGGECGSPLVPVGLSGTRGA